MDMRSFSDGIHFEYHRILTKIHRGWKAKAKSDSLLRYRSNLQGEVDGAAIYTALAESEADPKLAEVFRRLAAVEQAHGEFGEWGPTSA